MTKPAKIIASISVVVLVGIVGGLITYFANNSMLSDWISSFGYEDTQEIANLRSKLNLTDRANLMLSASQPNLQTRDEFNEACNSHNTEISILGCYTNGKIYIYNINREDLSGITESTLAHELLHASWERMNTSEREQISVYLEEVYNDSKYHEMLESDLNTYNIEERENELYTRIGTEVKDLPEYLKNHYATIFNDQASIVGFYESYITPFNELSAKINQLSERLNSLSAEINTKTDNYQTQAKELTSRIETFNNCAKTTGCFASSYDFNRQRQILVNDQNNLNNTYRELSDAITNYNKIVAEYNQIVIYNNELSTAINSNSIEQPVELDSD